MLLFFQMVVEVGCAFSLKQLRIELSELSVGIRHSDKRLSSCTLVEQCRISKYI